MIGFEAEHLYLPRRQRHRLTLLNRAGGVPSAENLRPERASVLDPFYVLAGAASRRFAH